MNTINSYPVSAKLLHWASALMILSMLFLGVSMIQSLAPWQVTALALHQSFGVLVLIVILVRLLNKVRFTSPSLPTDLPKPQQIAAHVSHVLLYTGMLAMPLSGWLMQNANGVMISPFGLFDLPALIAPRIEYYGFFRELHGLTAWLLFGLILLHIAGALYHGLIRRDRVFQSMTFGLGKPKKQ